MGYIVGTDMLIARDHELRNLDKLEGVLSSRCGAGAATRRAWSIGPIDRPHAPSGARGGRRRVRGVAASAEKNARRRGRRTGRTYVEDRAVGGARGEEH